MSDNHETSDELFEELAALRARVAELEGIEAKHSLMEAALRESVARYRTLFDEVPVALYRTTPDGRYMDANPAMVRIAGYPDREALLFTSSVELYSRTEDRLRWKAMMEEREIVQDFEFQLRRSDGGTIWVKNTARAVKDGNGEVICYEGSMEEITQRKNAQDALEQANEGLSAQLAAIAHLQEQLREQAIRDHLTTLFNRRYLEEILTQELAKAERKNYAVSLIMLDIDYFKQINDTNGHRAGDQALRSLGAYILSSIRRGDIACRFGGDEFVIVMPEATVSQAYERAEALRLGVRERVKVGSDNSEPVTISEGIAAYPVNGSTGEELLRAADQALFAAKARGRNRAVAASNLSKS
jgi:diguanylate cyclase (GGDEF)-like protein/PAS domain S-box-containing protein